jgi:hypothetical protein
MDLKRVLTIAFKVFCVFGLAAQLHEVCDSYFRFLTSSRMTYEVREMEYFQTIVICPRIMDIIDRTDYQKSGILQDLQLNQIPKLAGLTLKTIFKLTPKSDQVIQHCALRDSKLMRMSDPAKEDSQCMELFSVSKSVSGERVCYFITPKYLKNYSVGDVSSYLTYQNIAYLVSFGGGPLERAVLGQFITYLRHENDEPLYSRMFSRFVNKFESNLSRTGVDLFGQSVEIERLPPPYDTQCLEGHDRQVCYENCLKEKFIQINRVPWSSFIRKPSHLKIFTYPDMRNITNKTFANAAIFECHSACKLRSECHTTFTVTTLTHHNSNDFYVTSMVPSGPHMHLTSLRYMTIIDFLVQVGSCFGIWLGLSINTLDPTKLMKPPEKASPQVIRFRVISHPSRFRKSILK